MESTIVLFVVKAHRAALVLTDCFFSCLQNFSNTKNYLPPEMKSFFTPGKVCFETCLSIYVEVNFGVISGPVVLFCFLNNFLCLKIGNIIN